MDAVRVECQLVDEDGKKVGEKRFSLDPLISNYDMLKSLLAKAFEIKSDFWIYYLAVDQESSIVQLSLLNDWDLDAAIQCSSQPQLKLRVRVSEQDLSLEDWDIVVPSDIPLESNAKVKYQQIQKNGSFLNIFTDKLFNKPSHKTNDASKFSKLPMKRNDFSSYMDSSGKLVNDKAFRDCVFKGGIHPEIRKKAWQHLLHIYPSDLTKKERSEYKKGKKEEYENLKYRWQELINSGCINEEMHFITSMVRKDVIRTDRVHPYFSGDENNKSIESLYDILCTYAINHPDVSYCQGMSDMASVLLIVQKDEALAYLCFCSLMRRLKYNFMSDGKAMQCKFDHLKLLLSYHDPEFWTYMIENDVSDLFFTYRWLLLELKREFPFEDALRMLEIMWSTVPEEAPVTGIELSDVGFNGPESPLVVHSPTLLNHSCSSGTPTPYTKLRTLCRSKSNTPTSFHNEKKCSKASSVEECTFNEQLKQQSRTSDSSSSVELLSEDTQNPETRFYIGVKETHSGSLIYIPNHDESHDCVKKFAGNSMSSADSGVPASSQNTSPLPDLPDLQFALESSDDHSHKFRQPIFPKPHEFGFGNPFLMYASLTMILQHRKHIMQNKLDFDSIVLLFDRSIRRNDVNAILDEAKAFYLNYMIYDQQLVDCCSSSTINV